MRRVVSEHRLPSRILAALLAETYPSDQRGHQKGEPIFRLDFEPGDAEERFAICSFDPEELAERGYRSDPVACRIFRAPPLEAPLR